MNLQLHSSGWQIKLSMIKKKKNHYTVSMSSINVSRGEPVLYVTQMD